MRYLNSFLLSIVTLIGCTALGFADTNTDAKISALSRACAAGALPQDCAQRRAALHDGGNVVLADDRGSARPSGGNQNVYNDPQGRFSAPVPPGWNVNSDNGNATFTSGTSWIMLIASPYSQPDQAATAIINQFRQQYKSLDQAQSGRPTISGNSAVFATFRGVNGKGEQVALTVAGIQAPGNHVLVYLSSAPLSEINQISPTLQNVLFGIRFSSP